MPAEAEWATVTAVWHPPNYILCAAEGHLWSVRRAIFLPLRLACFCNLQSKFCFDHFHHSHFFTNQNFINEPLILHGKIETFDRTQILIKLKFKKSIQKLSRNFSFRFFLSVGISIRRYEKKKKRIRIRIHSFCKTSINIILHA